jgi:hypothetical protein
MNRIISRSHSAIVGDEWRIQPSEDDSRREAQTLHFVFIPLTEAGGPLILSLFYESDTEQAQAPIRERPRGVVGGAS